VIFRLDGLFRRLRGDPFSHLGDSRFAKAKVADSRPAFRSKALAGPAAHADRVLLFLPLTLKRDVLRRDDLARAAVKYAPQRTDLCGDGSRMEAATCRDAT
jgi:hypothetical protein